MNDTNNAFNGTHSVRVGEPVLEAEVATELEEVVQRAVQEALDSAQKPLAVVVAVEQTTDKNSSSRDDEEDDGKICGLSRRAVYIFMAVVAVVAIAIVVSAASLANKNEDDPSTTISTTEAPTTSPSMSSTMLNVRDFLYPNQSEIELSPAQREATLWIMEEDNFEWNHPSELLERHTLATLYFGLNGSKWSKTPNWLSNSTHCEWEAVSCNENNTTVVALMLSNAGLHGSVPSEIGRLSNLELLSMIDNRLTGELPAEMVRLSSLRGLNFATNLLWGRIPNLSTLSNLKDLTLGHNTLSGQIPPVGELTSLTWMVLNDNRLTGSLPDGLGKVALVHFNANNNQIGSTIPPELFGLSSLTTLRLENNLLSGAIPTEHDLPRLWSLYLSDNRLTSFPSAIGTMKSLTHLKLAHNPLNTTLPADLGRLNLNSFDVRGSQLHGSVPESLNRWTRIRKAYFSSNNFTGGLENLFCGKQLLRDLEADCGLVCNCCTSNCLE